MTVSCPECRSVFRVDPAKVPATGVRARCSVCGGVIAIAGGTLPVSVTPMGAPAFPGGVSRATPVVVPTPAGAAATGGTPTAAVAVPAPVPLRAPTPAAAAAPVPAPVAAANATPSAARAPINPFLRADPSQRARRLARALVSDLVAYHPQKREDGLRDGTLRQLFREDIKKSYEEYVEQVGREIAESAPHFQDALNDILAGGRRLF